MALIQVVCAGFLLLASVARAQSICENRDSPNVEEECVAIPSSSSCSRFYSHTTFPNNITTSTSDAETTLQTYSVFYTSSAFNCTPYNHLYVCLALMPHCTAAAGPSRARPPCKSFCDRMRANCQSTIMNNGGSALDVRCLIGNCNRYPTTDCVALDDPLVQAVVGTQSPGTTEGPTATDGREFCSENETDCCNYDYYFSDSSKEFALGWAAFWAVCCFISTTVTILTFLLDPSRFEYPWRPVIYLALSFNIHSLGYFLSYAIGRSNVTCPNGEFVGVSISWQWMHAPCIIVFGILYYTMMAAFMWWLMLTFCWCLASAFKWSTESIGHAAPFLHVICWVVPLLMTISLVAARVISADELTATCFVVRDMTRMSFLALLLGVIIPLMLCLVTGVAFLVIGFVSILRIHSFMRHGGKQRESNILEKLMIRIGIFVTVYIIPAAVLIGCFMYELLGRPGWDPDSCIGSDCSRPNVAVFMVRIFMFLLIGVLTGVWIWSPKTISSWKMLPSRISKCCQRSSEGDKIRSSEEPSSGGASINRMAVIPIHRPPSDIFVESGAESSI